MRPCRRPAPYQAYRPTPLRSPSRHLHNNGNTHSVRIPEDVERDAAVMVLDADCEKCLAKEVLALLADEKKRQTLAENARKMALPGAAEKIVEKVYEILASRK